MNPLIALALFLRAFSEQVHLRLEAKIKCPGALKSYYSVFIYGQTYPGQQDLVLNPPFRHETRLPCPDGVGF